MSVLDAEITDANDAPPIVEPDSAPKRGPGRPRKDGLPPGSVPPDRAKGTRRPRRQAAREQMAALVGGLNMIIALSPYRADCLTDDEMNILTDALTAEVSASERIGGWLGKAAGVTPHILLIQAIVRISIPRLIRHGVIPASVAEVPPELRDKVATMAQNGASEAEVMREIMDYAKQRADTASTASPV